VFGLINKITEQEENGRAQVQAIVTMLLNFAERNPGMTRVMIGDALINENERLQLRMNQFVERVELAVRQSLRLAASQQVQTNVAENDAAVRADLIVSAVLGHWQRYAKSGFANKPSDHAVQQIAMLLA